VPEGRDDTAQPEDEQLLRAVRGEDRSNDDAEDSEGRVDV